MADNQQENIVLNLLEIYPLLCPKCQLVIKKLLGEKLAEKVIEG